MVDRAAIGRAAAEPTGATITSTPLPTAADVAERARHDHITVRDGLAAASRALGKAERERLRWIRHGSEVQIWRIDGHRSADAWVAAETGLTRWKSRRLVACAERLDALPFIAAAIENGSLCIDKAVELTRFASPDDEAVLLRWARGVSARRIRERADELEAKRIEDAREGLDERRVALEWQERADGGDAHLHIDALLPPAEGRLVERALQGAADDLPDAPSGEPPYTRAQKLADALVGLVTSEGSDRPAAPTVVFHTRLDQLAADDGAVNLDGTMLHPETARRITCDARLQPVIEAKDGQPLGVGRDRRSPPEWLRRQVNHRDGGRCTFPACDAKRFIVPHHVQHWARGGPTDLVSLRLRCPYHHKLEHEGGWSSAIDPSGNEIFFRPSGRRYEPGVPPPVEPEQPAPDPELPYAKTLSYFPLFRILLT